MLIGVTDTLGSEYKLKKYLEWLQRSKKDVHVLTLSYKLDNVDALKLCDGLVLTGGHDVDPLLYHGTRQHQNIVNVDRRRDEFEYQVLDRALNANLPVLGICRGLQLANVFLGGTLIPDLEEIGYRSHQSEKDTMECRHSITVEQCSMLFEMTSIHTGIINSSHHQATLTPGKGLQVVARSDDGVIEAMELVDNGSVPFFLLVQWHPERMNDVENPFTKNILKRFLFSAGVTTN